jgi:hypothetical protein
MGSAAVRGLVKRRSEPRSGPAGSIWWTDEGKGTPAARRGRHLLAVKHSAETGNLRLGQLGRTRPRDVQDRQPGPTLW